MLGLTDKHYGVIVLYHGTILKIQLLQYKPLTVIYVEFMASWQFLLKTVL